MAFVDHRCPNESCPYLKETGEYFIGELEFKGLVPAVYEKPKCDYCGTEMKRVISPPQINLEPIRDAKWEGHNVGLAANVTSRSQAERIAKEKGLVWIGDDWLKEMKEERKRIVEEYHDKQAKEEILKRDIRNSLRPELIGANGMPIEPPAPPKTPQQILNERFPQYAGRVSIKKIGDKDTINVEI